MRTPFANIAALLVLPLLMVLPSACAGGERRTSSGAVEVGWCQIGGCSGQLCSDSSLPSTCEWKPEYACYKTATCAPQENGQCGWSMTPELTSCLADPPGP